MDVGLFFDDEGQIAPVLEDGDLKADETLETSCLISLFTDKRVSDGELPEKDEKKRGWWGDLYPDVQGDEIGSKLWLHDRDKVTPESLASMETRVAEAFQWMIDDGVASTVTVEGEYDEQNRAVFAIDISRPSGEKNRYSLVWDEQKLKRA